jgi:tetratricopeptide (TPR) repeat protein
MSNRNKSIKKPDSRQRAGISVLSALPLGVLAGATLIIAAGFLVYLPCISGGYLLDDTQLLTDNILVKLSNGLYHFWCTNEPIDYWPATNTTFWLEWRLWQMHLSGYHVTNLILHVVESLLIWIILRKLSVPGAFWAGLIFAVHPVNVEAVAWISQRKNVTAMLFFLLSILWYLKHLSLSGGDVNGSRREPVAETAHGVCGLHTDADQTRGVSGQLFDRWYWMSLAAFVLAMLGKGSVAILPALLLGIIWWLRPLTRRDLVRIAPYFIIGVILVEANVWFQRHGVETAIRTAGFAERLVGAGGVVWFYLYKAILPIDLSFVYPRWGIQAGNPLWWTPLLAALAVTAVLWAYRKTWSRPLLFAWGFFCTALLPVTGLMDVGFMKYTLVADRYQHIAIIGVIALASAGFGMWQTRARGVSRRAAGVVAVVTLCALVFLTLRQSGLYHDTQTLYEATLVKNPDCWMIRSLLGCIFIEEKRLPEAMKQFERAIRLNPNYTDAHSNLAMALDQSNRFLEAVSHCEEALRLKPVYPEAHHNLGIALAHLGRLGEAIEHYKKALEEKPFYPAAENSLGSALVQTGRPEEALKHFQEALNLKPDFAEAHFNLGSVLASSGRFQEAIEQYRQVMALSPNDPDTYYLMGDALIGMGRPGDAIGYFQQALRLKPGYAEVYNDLGVALIQTGQPKEAIACYEQALRLRPDYADAHYNLALAYARMHQSSQAIAAAQKALEFARSKGRSVLAEEIENWLDSYRAGLSGPGSTAPSSK